MWTPTTRQKHSRTVTRYQTDLTDTEWRVIAPHLPKPCAAGRPREWPMREIVNGIFYVMRAGCPWRLVPSDLPPWGTIYRWFAAWRDDGRFERINHALVMADRERVGRDAVMGIADHGRGTGRQLSYRFRIFQVTSHGTGTFAL
jgi:putative transposase